MPLSAWAATVVAPTSRLLILRNTNAFTTDGTTAASGPAQPLHAHLTSGPPLFRGGCGVDAVRLALDRSYFEFECLVSTPYPL
jgi:hypothetical protein